MTVRKTDAEPVPEGQAGGPSDGVEAGPFVQRPRPRSGTPRSWPRCAPTTAIHGRRAGS